MERGLGGGQPDTAAELQPGVMRQPQFEQLGADALGNRARALRADVAAQHRELVAAVAPGAVFGADAIADELADRTDDLVACGVPVGVVDPLEVIHVDHQQAGGLSTDMKKLQCGVGLFLPVLAGMQPRLGIGAAQVFKQLVLPRHGADQPVARHAARQGMHDQQRQGADDDPQ